MTTLERYEYTARILKEAYKDRVEYLPPDEDHRTYIDLYDNNRSYMTWKDGKLIDASDKGLLAAVLSSTPQ